MDVARAGDFDGDGMLDLVWKVKGLPGSCSAVYVSWLNASKNNIPVVAGELRRPQLSCLYCAGGGKT